MSIISNLISKYLDDKLTAANAQQLMNNALQSVASFVAGTSTTIDDAVFAEVEKDVDFNALAANSASWARTLLGLSAQTHFFAAQNATAKPHIFLMLVRGRLITEAVRKQGLSRQEARAKVAQLTDEQIMAKVDDANVARGAIGDSGILAWLQAHLPQLLQIITALLPLLLAL